MLLSLGSSGFFVVSATSEATSPINFIPAITAPALCNPHQQHSVHWRFDLLCTNNTEPDELGPSLSYRPPFARDIAGPKIRCREIVLADRLLGLLAENRRSLNWT
ncbi:hypothetical protein [Pseudaminobacter soli (ex Li et al. 2025)]|uniref:hypothetical protein n=1 Tax=Pseudaminobacter soli (ex Li et al. 2025) TaxID=1295366 RepID=UPI0011B29C4A|nr:hypothetical protein [Mesorhizobium soli]